MTFLEKQVVCRLFVETHLDNLVPKVKSMCFSPFIFIYDIVNVRGNKQLLCICCSSSSHCVKIIPHYKGCQTFCGLSRHEAVLLTVLFGLTFFHLYMGSGSVRFKFIYFSSVSRDIRACIAKYLTITVNPVKVHHQQPGEPQGTVLAPLLFTVCIPIVRCQLLKRNSSRLVLLCQFWTCSWTSDEPSEAAAARLAVGLIFIRS